MISKCRDAEIYSNKASLLFMLSIIEFTERLMLLVFLWVEKGPQSAIFVGITASFIIGSSVLSLMFLTLHLDPLVESSAALDEFAHTYKWSYRFTRLCSLIFGIHYIRILYSGVYGLAVSTNVKTLGNVNAFRFPLERLCLYNLMFINFPQLFQQIAVLGLYSYFTNSWQISLFGLVLNIFTSTYFFIDWYRGPWRI